MKTNKIKSGIESYSNDIPIINNKIKIKSTFLKNRN